MDANSLQLLREYEERGKLPFYKLVPKEFDANLTFREQILNDAQGDPDYQDELWMMCSRDILFYFNTFLWTYDPRRDPNELPFITYFYQDVSIVLMDHAIENGYHVNFKKSRDMGCSWMLDGVFRHRQKFRWRESFMLISRKQELVDQAGDPDSLFWKLDFLEEMEPKWMQEARERNELHHRNLETKGTIDGESTNRDVGRGGRRKAIGWDERAATPNGFEVIGAIALNTPCVIGVYTPKGTGTEAFSSEKNTLTVKLHWTEHPEHAKGLYQIVKGEAQVIDHGYPWPRDESGKITYEFVVDGPTVKEGMYRSPWYDDTCRKLHNIPALIAAELELDDSGSESQFFDQKFLDEVAEPLCKRPAYVGELDFDRDFCEPRKFIERDNGLFKLWCPLNDRGLPPRDRSYSVGNDVAAGTGASNSVLAVTDDLTGEKVGEYANPRIMPHEFARLAVAVARFFCDQNGEPAILIWEANGPGRNFGTTIIESGFRNIWWKRDDRKISPAPDDIPGWPPTKEGKIAMLGSYREAQMDKKYIDRSIECVKEQAAYVFLPNQSVAHSSAHQALDPSGANDNHGDRVIATALSYKASKNRRPTPAKLDQAPPKGSFLWRRLESQKKRKTGSYWSR